MFMEKYYIINQYFMYMVGYYDRNGKLCSKVTQVDKTFLVDRSPLSIIEDSIKCIGFDLRGALATSKWIVGNTYMCPVMINPVLKICVFPTKSFKNEDSIWLNPNQIIRTSGVYRSTNIEFKNGLTLRVACRLNSFNTKLQTAEQLKKITIEIAKNPMSFVLEPRKNNMQLSH